MANPRNVAPWSKRITIAPGDKGTEQELKLAAGYVNQALADDQFAQDVRNVILNGGRIGYRFDPNTLAKVYVDEVPVAPVDPRDVPAVFGNVFQWIQANIGFQPDPLTDADTSVMDYIQTPHRTLYYERLGDCLSLASLADSFSMALGHGAAYRSLRADPTDPTRFSHVYALLGYRDGSGAAVWLPADMTQARGALGDEPPNLDQFDPHDFLIADAS